MKFKYFPFLILILFSMMMNAQSNFTLTSQYGRFFTGYKDRSGSKLQVGLGYKFNKRFELNFNFNSLIYHQKETFYTKENTLFYDIHPEKFPLPSIESPINQDFIENYGLKKLSPGFFSHNYKLSNLEIRYKILDRKFSIKAGIGFSYIVGDIVELGKATDVIIMSLITKEEARARLVIPILIRYIDIGYVWSVNLGYRLNQRTNVISTILTHSSFLKSTGPVSASIGLEVDL